MEHKLTSAPSWEGELEDVYQKENNMEQYTIYSAVVILMRPIRYTSLPFFFEICTLKSHTKLYTVAIYRGQRARTTHPPLQTHVYNAYHFKWKENYLTKKLYIFMEKVHNFRFFSARHSYLFILFLADFTVLEFEFFDIYMYLNIYSLTKPSRIYAFINLAFKISISIISN